MAFSEFRDIRIAAIVSAVPETSTSANSGVPRASAEQTASDLGYSAVRNILDHEGIDKEEVGILIFASKTPDYRSPATACVLHGRLGFSVDCVAFDVNLGSNGFTLGLQSVCSLLASSKKKYAILVAGDTTSKQTSESKLEKIRFGDGVTCILIEKKEGALPIKIMTGTDSALHDKFQVAKGGFRYSQEVKDIEEMHLSKSAKFSSLYLDEKLWIEYAKKTIPASLLSFTEKINENLNTYDLVLAQQIGSETVRAIEGELGLPEHKLPKEVSNTGDLCAASIPILLEKQLKNGRSPAPRILCISIGEGFSWGCMDFKLDDRAYVETILSDEVFEEGSVSHEF